MHGRHDRNGKKAKSMGTGGLVYIHNIAVANISTQSSFTELGDYYRSIIGFQ